MAQLSAAKAGGRAGRWWILSRADKRALLADMWLTVASIPDFAADLGCSVQNLTNLARKMGLPCRPIRRSTRIFARKPRAYR